MTFLRPYLYALQFWVLPNGTAGIREIGDFGAILHDLSEHFSCIEWAGGIAAIVKQARAVFAVADSKELIGIINVTSFEILAVTLPPG